MMYEFDAKLEILPGKLPWTVFYVPFSVKDEFSTNGRVQVKTEIELYSLEGVLLPSKNGHYMVFNKEFQKLCKKKLGDTIHVKLESDTTPHVLTIPNLIMEKLQQDKDILDKFYKLPHYIKKEEIRKIMNAKKEETKLRRADKLIQNLLNE